MPMEQTIRVTIERGRVAAGGIILLRGGVSHTLGSAGAAAAAASDDEDDEDDPTFVSHTLGSAGAAAAAASGRPNF